MFEPRNDTYTLEAWKRRQKLSEVDEPTPEVVIELPANEDKGTYRRAGTEQLYDPDGALCNNEFYSETYLTPTAHDPVDLKERREEQAKLICQMCPLFGVCLDNALNNNLHGIWASTDDAARQRMLGKKIRSLYEQ